MGISVLMEMLPKLVGLYTWERKTPPMDVRGGVVGKGEKLSSQIFRLIEKSCDWSVTKCEKNVFQKSYAK